MSDSPFNSFYDGLKIRKQINVETFNLILYVDYSGTRLQ